MLKETVIIPWKVWKKDLWLLAIILNGKIVNPSNAKKYFNSYLKRRNRKLVKQPK